MTKTLSQLKKQIAALQKQAEELQRKESKEVIARIKEAIAFYDLGPADLGFGGGGGAPKAGGRSRAPKAGGASDAKYRDDAGNTWGGRGPRPQWLRDALANGKKLEDFRAQGGEASPAARKPARGKKSAAKVKYRDQAGNTWSGRGPRPRWLTQALAGGASLQDLAA